MEFIPRYVGFGEFTHCPSCGEMTPSTNDINRTNGWAHVDQLSQDPGTTDLQFISTRAFYSCFEYRTDGDTSQKISETNFNTLVTDGLYPYYCQNNNSSTHAISADAYVEVRMVFGAEGDERFDWTRFNVDPPNCQPTGLVRDGINMTAAVINPASPVTGNVYAGGCNIGVYYGPGNTGSVNGASRVTPAHRTAHAPTACTVASSVATRLRSRRIGMAGKSKKHHVSNPVSLGTGVKAPMVSLKVKKQKKRSRGK